MLNGNVLDYFGPEVQEKADREVAKEHGHQCGLPVEREQDYVRDCVSLVCPTCQWRQLFTGEILFRLTEPHCRRIAYEQIPLAKSMRHQQIAAEVREQPPTNASDVELKQRADQALEDRDPEAGMRTIAQLMDKRRPAKVREGE